MSELGAPTESEVLRLFGVGHRQLGLDPMQCTSEDNQTLSVFPISLHGIPLQKLAGIRRLRLISRVFVSRGEHFVWPASQIAEQQGETWLNFLSTQLTQKRRTDMSSKKKGPLNLKTYEDLHAKAMELQGVLSAQQAQMYEDEPAAIAAGEAGDGGENLSPDADCESGDEGYRPDAEARTRKAAKVEDPQAAMMRAVGQEPPSQRVKRAAAGSAEGRGRGRGQKKRGKKTQDDDDQPTAEVSDDEEHRAWVPISTVYTPYNARESSALCTASCFPELS